MFFARTFDMENVRKINSKISENYENGVISTWELNTTTKLHHTF